MARVKQGKVVVVVYYISGSLFLLNTTLAVVSLGDRNTDRQMGWGSAQSAENLLHPSLPVPPLPRSTVHMLWVSLHNRVTGEIKRTVLLRGRAWFSFLTHILSSTVSV